MAKTINGSNLEEILGGGKPVVIDFWAVWCGPCKALSPTVDEIAAEYEGRVEVCKCNVDECQDIAMNFGIRNIPTLLFFKNGELAARMVGVVSRAEIEEKINSIINN